MTEGKSHYRTISSKFVPYEIAKRTHYIVTKGLSEFLEEMISPTRMQIRTVYMARVRMRISLPLFILKA